MSERTHNPYSWLEHNRSLRMDANSDLFSGERRQFHLDRYQFAMRYCEKKHVLDGACGTGYGSSILSDVAAHVCGIDCADDAVEYAARTYSTAKVDFRKSFVEMTPFDSSSFDVVVSFETIEHTLCPSAHLMEIARLLKPNSGCAVLSAPNRWGYTAHHFIDFNLPLLKSITAQFFADARFFYQNLRSAKALPGIGPLVSDAPSDAQCIIAVCIGPRKHMVVDDRLDAVMSEIYRNVFARHQDFQAMSYKLHTSMLWRIVNKLRAVLSRRHSLRA